MTEDSKVKYIIFLDIDGVMNCQPDKPKEIWPDYKGGNDERAYGINPDLAKNLKKVIDETGAKIVVSSSWRYFDDYFIFDPNKDWRDVLAGLMGYDAKDLFIGNTPSIAMVEYVFRGHEIQNWMKDNEDKYGVAGEAYKYCIIDDCVKDILNVFNPRYVMHTDFKKGLTDEDATKVIHILKTA